MNQTSIEKLRILLNQEHQAIIDKDIVFLNEVLARSMEVNNFTGCHQTKLDWIEQIQNDEVQYLKIIEEKVEDAQIKADEASLKGIYLITARICGSNINTWQVEMKAHFKKSRNRWLIISQTYSVKK